MMGREWQPGDVAMVEVFGKDQRVFRTHKGWWCFADGGTAGIGYEDRQTLRPLVVIDPEDREQVERLTRAWAKAFMWLQPVAISDVACAVDALLHFVANPTPPPCRASVNVRIHTNYIAASCGEPLGHGGSHRSDNGTSWDATEASA